MDLQLSWFDRLEYRGSINHATVMHDVPDPACVANIDERIVVEEDKVGPLSHLDGAEIFIRAQNPGSSAGARMNRLHRR